MKTARTLLYALTFCLFPACGRAGTLEPMDHQPIPALITALKAGGHERIAQGLEGVLLRDARTGEVTAATDKAALMVTANRKTGDWTISVLDGETTGSTMLIGSGLEQPAPGSSVAMPTFDRARAQATIAKLANCDATYYPDEIRKLTQASGTRRVYSGQVSFMAASALEMASRYRQESIDKNVLHLTIDGEKIDISQRDLRKLMRERIAELEAEKRRLEANNDRTGLVRLAALIKDYGAQAKQAEVHAAPDFTGAMTPAFVDVLVAQSGGFCILVVDHYGACVPIAYGEGFAEKPQKSTD